MPDAHSEASRTVPERVGALEQDMHTVKHRLDRFERHHEDIPLKVNRLEMIAANQSELLKSLSSDVKTMGRQVLYGLGAAGAIISLLQLVGPHIVKAMFP